MLNSILQKIRRRLLLYKHNTIRNIYSYFYRHYTSNHRFTIISNNCWGGDIYTLFKSPFNTPFIGLFLNAPCYIKFLKQPEYYLSQDLHFVTSSKYKKINSTKEYPIGILDDIEIHFLHYKSKEEAKMKWEKRSKRLGPSNTWLVKFDDRDNCNSTLVKEFHSLPYRNKISFTSVYFDLESNVQLKNPTDLILLHTTYDLVDIPILLDKGIVQKTSSKISRLHKVLKYPSKF